MRFLQNRPHDVAFVFTTDCERVHPLMIRQENVRPASQQQTDDGRVIPIRLKSFITLDTNKRRNNEPYCIMQRGPSSSLDYDKRRT